MSSNLMERLQTIAQENAERGDAWNAICTVAYGDIIAMSRVLEDAENVRIDGKALTAEPSPEDSSAKSLIDAMRKVILSAVSKEHREAVEAAFPACEFLEGMEAPDSINKVSAVLRERTEGLKPHAYKARKALDAKVHANAAVKMAAAGVDEVDVNAAMRASDMDAFETSSVTYALSHADWQLCGHEVRMGLMKNDSERIQPDAGREALRSVLSDQFEGLVTQGDIEWEVKEQTSSDSEDE